jgi:alkanesulfonate monooxygenase SsuD/methylene tetrahydromethanopterin reductase-like flavin-dependent oxidoreductase (luciferase family)
MTALLRSADMIHLMKHDPDTVSDDEVDADYCLEHLCIVGDVDECTRRLMDVWETTGGFGQLLMIAHDWDDPDKWRRSMRLLAEEVVPALPTI